MLSIHTLKTAAEASRYYQTESYYTKENNQKLQESSTWDGKGAPQLGLSDKVDPVLFKKMLEGNDLLHSKQNTPHHRPGYDLTFSAPNERRWGLACIIVFSDKMQFLKIEKSDKGHNTIMQA